jgi:hypothetical protein
VVNLLISVLYQDNLTRQLTKAQSEADHWRHKYEKDGMAKVNDPYINQGERSVTLIIIRGQRSMTFTNSL